MKQKKAILIAVAVAFLAVFGAWLSTRASNINTETEQTNIDLVDLRKNNKTVALTNDEHILGSPDALVFLVVYTDFQCPFCAEYHKTLETIIDIYGPSGEVAIVYRHMPLVQLHPHSPLYHLASECVHESAGASGFWTFAEKVFTHPDTTGAASSTLLTTLAVEAGANTEQFTACMQAETYKQKVQDSFDTAWGMGIRSTPYTVLVTPYQEIVLDEVRSFKTIAASLETILRVLRKDPALQ